MHEAYTPDPRTYPEWDSGRTYCPGCFRIVRCGLGGQLGPDPTYYRHWVDPDAPKGDRDRCVNSRTPVAEAWFVRGDGRVVPRAAWEEAPCAPPDAPSS